MTDRGLPSRLFPGLLVILIACTVPVPTGFASARPGIGLVLGGGGARGSAHIGVLMVLEEMRIPVDVIAGTSMGAVIGGLYASGLTPAELETAISGIDWKDAFTDAPLRESLTYRNKKQKTRFMVYSDAGLKGGDIVLPPGLIQGQKLNLLLKSLTLPVFHITDFDRLPTPFRAVATDIATGDRVVIDAGNLADAMRASMAVPGIFAPVRLNDRLLVDGGVVANVPVETARAAGADRFIVVDVGAPLRKQPEIRSALDVTDQLLRLLTRNNVKEQLKTLTGRDVYIRPELGDISSLNFDLVQSAISAGKAAAKNSVDELRRLSVSPKTYADYRRKRREKRRHAPVTVDAIRILNDSRISDAVLEHRIQTQIGETLDMETLESDFEAIYRLDVFESVDFSLDRKDEKTVLVIDANRKRWGPNYLQLGLRLEDDLQGENTYDINFGFSATERNSKGGVWRLEARIGENPRFFTEYFQPLGDSLRWFVNPLFEYEKRNVRLFEGADAVSQYRVTTAAAGLETGRALGTFGQIAVGVRRENGKAEIRVGDPDTDDYYFDDGSIYARFGYDKMDDIFFPRRGGMARITLTGYREQLGSAENLETADVTGAWSKSLSDNTFLLVVETATAFESDIPIQNTHSLGGFLHLSGYRFNERFGNHLVFGELVYYRQLRHLLPIPVYLGASLEAGNVWAKAEDIRPASLIPAGSLFFGTQTPLGPVYLGTGLAEGGRHSFYFFLGKALFP